MIQIIIARWLFVLVASYTWEIFERLPTKGVSLKISVANFAYNQI